MSRAFHDVSRIGFCKTLSVHYPSVCLWNENVRNHSRTPEELIPTKSISPFLLSVAPARFRRCMDSRPPCRSQSPPSFFNIVCNSSAGFWSPSSILCRTTGVAGPSRQGLLWRQQVARLPPSQIKWILNEAALLILPVLYLTMFQVFIVGWQCVSKKQPKHGSTKLLESQLRSVLVYIKRSHFRHSSRVYDRTW